MRWAMVVVVAAGCSLATVQGPPSPVPAQGPIGCDPSAGGAALTDLLLGTASGLLGYAVVATGFALGNDCPEDDTSCTHELTTGDKLEAATFGVVLTLPWFYSLYVGRARTTSCAALKHQTGR